MAPVFVDTSIWYAAADGGDSHNAVAQGLLSAHSEALITSDLVLGELWNLLNARADHRIANRVIGSLASGIARVECVLPADLEAAAAAAGAFEDQAFSLTDRTSWALMERLGIADALALDADFRVYRYGPGLRRAFTVHP